MPYIQRIDVRNHYKVADFSVTLPERADGPRHLIVTGPNATGKTTILEKLADEVERYTRNVGYPGSAAVLRNVEQENPSVRNRYKLPLTLRGSKEERLAQIEAWLAGFFVELAWTAGDVGDDTASGRFVSAFLRVARLDRFHGVSGTQQLQFHQNRLATHSPAIICSIDHTVVLDLSHPDTPVASESLRGVPYGRLMTSHFGIETDLDLQSTRALHRLKALRDQPSLTPDDHPAAEPSA